MSLIDRGRARVLLYRDGAIPDEYGNTTRGPVGEPVEVWATVQYAETEAGGDRGQGVATEARVIARDLPTGAFGGVDWDGRLWDVVGEVRRRRSGTSAVHHDELRMRARTPPAVTGG